MLNDIDDEILNGPFGDVRGKVWGEDYNNSCALSTIPDGAVVYSGTKNASTGASMSNGKVTMLRHPDKNFFWCGDSGLIHGGTSTSNTNTPFKIGEVVKNGTNYPLYPINKEGYGTGSRQSVCNSTIFANVMAWALLQSETNGINK